MSKIEVIDYAPQVLEIIPSLENLTKLKTDEGTVGIMGGQLVNCKFLAGKAYRCYLNKHPEYDYIMNHIQAIKRLHDERSITGVLGGLANRIDLLADENGPSFILVSYFRTEKP